MNLCDVLTTDMERAIDGIASLHGFVTVETRGASPCSVAVKVPGHNRPGGDYIVNDDGSLIDQILLKDYSATLWESRVKRQLERGTPPFGMLMT
jgi:hypothetical protein